MTEIKAKINHFLADYFEDRQLQEDEDIFASGFINSMFAMQLVLFVEQEFEVTIEDDELDFDNFRTINAMANLLERKKVALSN
ncbi:D-alanyl carrier protein [Hyella patelloides LEGE 07179]|uniref:D-alanyl carrier protein n=1 Tax=Hyella patelloides LEGE 07179 TaxID=945734 RepID=A0A563W1Z1_9CYAN|nr:phosphopantetheine-binding protein [Hyella patelloides]VEP17553.1 D-alanyl carrier protein [Hyella patelloides LEGE 07179]